jgi:cell division protein FtsW
LTSPTRVLSPTRTLGQRSSAAKTSSPKTARISLGRVVRTESSTYFMLLGTTLFLLLFGLVMVLSSSSVTSFTGSKDFFGVFLRQGLFAMIGIPMMLLISRLPVRIWRRFAWVPLVTGMVLQIIVLTTSLGVEVAGSGNKNWIGIGSFNLQPSELIKVGLVAWLGVILAKKEQHLGRWGHVLIPVVPVAGFAIILVLIGGDLGTVIIMAGLVLGALFFAGVRLRMLVLPVIVGGAIAILFAVSSPSRMERIQEFLGGGGGGSDYQGTAWQSTQGQWALADGGLFGVGLGNSKAKWSWLPAADNDFIFAVIGEELGLLGAIVVLALFITLAISFLRIIRRSNDLFSRVVTGGVMVWLVGQAFVNIAVVLGVIPVFGVPLPLISSGGSALITTMIAIGLVLSIAKSSEERTTPGEPIAGATR